MQEVFEKIIEKLEGMERFYNSASDDDQFIRYGIRVAKTIMQDEIKDYNNGWIPVEEKLPEDDGYILVSFSNYTLADVARYEENEEGGTFYPGDDEKSYVSYGLFVNAWQPLPKCWKGENNG